MDDKICFKIQVKGHVQGVGFRWSASREARSMGITGFVRNQSDGSVYIEAEGWKEQLDVFAEWCKNGPGLVEDITISLSPPAGYKDFRIEF